MGIVENSGEDHDLRTILTVDNFKVFAKLRSTLNSFKLSHLLKRLPIIYGNYPSPFPIVSTTDYNHFFRYLHWSTTTFHCYLSNRVQ